MDNEIKVLIFKINGEYYAADITEVERIISYQPTTKLPDSPDFVEGVINHEGSILPIINVAKKFNLEKKDVSDVCKIIAAKDENIKFGIIVEEVSEVKDINKDSIEKASDIVSGIAKRYLKGLIKINDKIIIFLNLSSILTDEEKQIIL